MRDLNAVRCPGVPGASSWMPVPVLLVSIARHATGGEALGNSGRYTTDCTGVSGIITLCKPPCLTAEGARRSAVDMEAEVSAVCSKVMAAGNMLGTLGQFHVRDSSSLAIEEFPVANFSC